MSLRGDAISRWRPFEFTWLMRVCESKRTRREHIPPRRAEFMAFRNTNVSAIRGDTTKDSVVECDEDNPASSMIQARPTH
ncbi:hypothetical protein DY000_02051849 [Brassica cretica]|uniref:Uncharacterized protein n=1 Tax=Brassica cretica TaxID=69181 RepID=A0ABQ7A881_BRACR|nr:hypothetical protein DY000_02051849 [Brassica cretica]